MMKIVKIVMLTLFLSVSSQAAMQKSGKINIDPKPIEDILNKYYDICETTKAVPSTGYDQKSLDAMKPLLVVQTDRSASLSLCL